MVFKQDRYPSAASAFICVEYRIVIIARKTKIAALLAVQFQMSNEERLIVPIWIFTMAIGTQINADGGSAGDPGGFAPAPPCGARSTGRPPPALRAATSGRSRSRDLLTSLVVLMNADAEEWYSSKTDIHPQHPRSSVHIIGDYCQ